MTTPTLAAAIALIQRHLDLQARLNEPGSVEQVRQVYDDMREMCFSYRDNPPLDSGPRIVEVMPDVHISVYQELAAVRKQRDALLAACRTFYADSEISTRLWAEYPEAAVVISDAIAACEPAAGEGEA